MTANTFQTSRPQMLRRTCAYPQRGDSGFPDTVQSRNLSDRVLPKPEKPRWSSSWAAAEKAQSLHNVTTCAETWKNGQMAVVLCDLEIKLYMSYSKYKFRIVSVKMLQRLWEEKQGHRPGEWADDQEKKMLVFYSLSAKCLLMRPGCTSANARKGFVSFTGELFEGQRGEKALI